MRIVRFLGGPVDNTRQEVSDKTFDRGYVEVVKLLGYSPFILNADAVLDPVSRETRSHLYVREYIVGERGRKFYFFRHHKLSANETLERFFS